LAGIAALHNVIPEAVNILSAEIKAREVNAVGYDVLHPLILEGIKAELPNVSFSCINDDMIDIRRTKSFSEITLLERAAEENLQFLNEAFSEAVPGMTDRDLIAIALEAQQRASSDLITHFTCNVQAGS